VTTIATDGRRIAADGRVTASDGEILTETHAKLWELPDGSVIGSSGDRASAQKAKAELRSAINERREPEDVPGDYRLIRLYRSGSIAIYDLGVLSQPMFVEAPFAIGSGGMYARAALAGGASLSKAMKIAHAFDAFTGPLNQLLRP
jgi:ATP-dependent protease HslVU (ClpYQ) peptidase subunit